MNRENKNTYFNALILFCAYIFFTITAMRFDRLSIGPNESIVGFSTVNLFFKNLLGYNPLFYKISSILGYGIILITVMFFVYTIFDIIKNKSLSKIDRSLFFLMVYYFLLVIVYIIFDKVVVINYRPVILKTTLEPSYPSTHTFLAIAIMSAANTQFRLKIKDVDLCSKVNIIFTIYTFAVVFSRFLSGVHWFSDIIGGILLGAAFGILYKAIVLFSSK